MTAHTDDDVILAWQVWDASEGERDRMGRVLDAVSPAIAARALRQAADAIVSETPHAPYNAAVVAKWLRARAEQVNP